MLIRVILISRSLLIFEGYRNRVNHNCLREFNLFLEHQTIIILELFHVPEFYQRKTSRCEILADSAEP